MFLIQMVASLIFISTSYASTGPFFQCSEATGKELHVFVETDAITQIFEKDIHKEFLAHGIQKVQLFSETSDFSELLDLKNGAILIVTSGFSREWVAGSARIRNLQILQLQNQVVVYRYAPAGLHHRNAPFSISIPNNSPPKPHHVAFISRLGATPADADYRELFLEPSDKPILRRQDDTDPAKILEWILRITSPKARSLLRVLTARQTVTLPMINYTAKIYAPGIESYHEAEVILSGALVETSPKGTEKQFEFKPGVRELLRTSADVGDLFALDRRLKEIGM